MLKEYKSCFTFFMFLFISFNELKAQVKLEEEFRLKADEIPEWAEKFQEDLGKNTKVIWYSEKNLKGKSVEAKFRFEKRSYSVEFDTTGQLQDVEIEVMVKDLPKDISSVQEQELDSIFKAYRIIKIQEQYVPDQGTLVKFILEFSGYDKGLRSYEVVVTGKMESIVKQYELTFSNKGRLLKQEEIILRNSDNLAY